MADNDSSSVVAIVAIIIIVILGIGFTYYATNGFQMNKAGSSTTVVAPKVDVTPSTGGGQQ